jgi:hypothetical protein
MSAHSCARMAALLAVLMIAFSIAPIWNCIRGNPNNKDYNLWYATGQTVLQGGEVYPKDPHKLFPFMYPPSCAALLAVASVAGERPFVVGLTLINSAAWIAAILLAVHLAAGTDARRNRWLYIVPTAIVLPYVHDTYLLGQPNLLLLALMLGAFACLRRGQDKWAGSLIALAAAIKAFPILAVGYLVYRRRWKATIATVVTLLALLVVVPLPLRGPARAWDDLVTWNRGMVLKYDADGIAQRPERCYSFKNQSLPALANRLLRPISADGEADPNYKVNIASFGFATVNLVVAAVALGLCLFYVAMMPARSQRTPRSDAVEQAMLLILILLFSPLSFNYFFVWLLYPFTIALALAFEAPPRSRERAIRWAWLLAAVTALALALPFLRAAQAYGNLFVTSLILFVGLGRALGLSRLTGTAALESSGSVLALPAAGRRPAAGARLVGAKGRVVAGGLVGLVAIAGGLAAAQHWYDWFEKKVRVVEPGALVRGAWQKPGPLRRVIAREKIKTIVTVVGTSHESRRYREQARVVRETGVKWIVVPVVTSRPNLAEMAVEADLLADVGLRPIFFHCIAGHHRTNLALAAYRIRHEGWSASRAWREACAVPWARPAAEVEDRRLIEAFADSTSARTFRR